MRIGETNMSLNSCQGFAVAGALIALTTPSCAFSCANTWRSAASSNWFCLTIWPMNSSTSGLSWSLAGTCASVGLAAPAETIAIAISSCAFRIALPDYLVDWHRDSICARTNRGARAFQITRRRLGATRLRHPRADDDLAECRQFHLRHHRHRVVE